MEYIDMIYSWDVLGSKILNYTYIHSYIYLLQVNWGPSQLWTVWETLIFGPPTNLNTALTLHAHSSRKMPYQASQSAAQEPNASHPSVPWNHVSHGLLAMLEVFSIAILHWKIDATNTKQNTWEVMKKLILDSSKSKICLKWFFMKRSFGHLYSVISSNSTGQPKCGPLQIKTIEKANLGHVFG